MCDTAYHQEAKRQARFLQRKKEALEKLAQMTGEKKQYNARALPFPDYPHEERKDVFGIGGYDDVPINHVKQADFLQHLQHKTDTGSEMTPVVFHTLRRRGMRLKNGHMYQGPYTAFDDYFDEYSASAGSDACSHN